jgi:hypothetical protein
LTLAFPPRQFLDQPTNTSLKFGRIATNLGFCPPCQRSCICFLFRLLA